MLLADPCCCDRCPAKMFFQRQFQATYGTDPPTYVLTYDDSSWPADLCALPYTNMHVAESGAWHVGGRCYTAGSGFAVHAAAPPLTNGPKQWLWTDTENNLYAIDLRIDEIPTGGSDPSGPTTYWAYADIWMYRNSTSSTHLIYTQERVINKRMLETLNETWPNVLQPQFNGPPRHSAGDVRFGYLAISGIGATTLNAGTNGWFRYNGTVTVLDIRDCQAGTSDTATLVYTHAYQDRQHSYGSSYPTPPVLVYHGVDPETGEQIFRAPITYFDAITEHLRIGGDGGLYVSLEAPPQAGVSDPTATAQANGWGWNNDFLTENQGNYVPVPAVCFIGITPDVRDLPYPDDPTNSPTRYYGRWRGDHDVSGAGDTFDNEIMRQGGAKQFDVDGNGNVVLVVERRVEPSDDDPPTQNHAIGHAIVRLVQSPGITDTLYLVGSDPENGYYAEQYVEDWEVVDSDAVNPSWPAHDASDGAYYLTERCLRRTDGVTAPTETHVWGRDADCLSVSPAFLFRNDPNVNPFGGTPSPGDITLSNYYTATHGVMYDIPSDRPECTSDCTDYDPPGIETDCCANAIPVNLSLTITGTSPGITIVVDEVVPPSGGDPVKTWSWTLTFSGAGCAAGNHEATISITCTEISPGVFEWRVTGSGLNVAADSVTCDPFSLTLSGIATEDVGVVDCPGGSFSIEITE